MGGWLRGIRTSSSRSRSRIASGRICASWRAERVRAHCSAGPRAGRALRARPGEMKEKRGALRALFGGGEGVSGCGEGGAGEVVGLRGRWDICRRERKGKLRAFERSWAPQGNHESRTQAARVVHESAADEEGTSAASCDEGSDELTNSARDSAGCQRADPCRVEEQERAAGPEDSTWIAKTRGSFQEGEGTRRVRVAALQHPARSPPLDGRGEEQTEAVEGAAGAGDPPREVVELALASQEGRRVRGAVLRGRTPERAADLADDPLHPEQRPQARPASDASDTSPIPPCSPPTHPQRGVSGSGTRFISTVPSPSSEIQSLHFQAASAWPEAWMRSSSGQVARSIAARPS